MNGPTAVFLVLALGWPVLSLVWKALDRQIHSGSFTWEVTDTDGTVIETGTATLERDASQQARECANTIGARVSKETKQR